ncbi:MAG: MFS transporter [Patescibacteria group bacterium]
MTAFRDVFERFLATHASRQVKGLMSATAVLDFAVSSIALFEPIYLYALGWSLASICAFYLAIYALTFFLLPFGARYVGRLGFQHAMLFSSPFLIVYFLALYAIPRHPAFIGLAVVAFAVQKILYWPAFHAEMARFGRDGERGREVSNMASLASFATILGPTFGGVLIGLYGFPVAFIAASLLILASNIPLISIPEERSKDGFAYLPALKRVFSKERRADLAAMSGFGEEFVVQAIWPIFLFVTLKGFAATGVVVSVSILLTTLTMLFIGRITDLQSRHAVMRTGAIFTSFSWALRPFLIGPLGVLAGDFFYRASRSLLGIPMMAVLYERVSKGPFFERLISLEMSIMLGKALMMAVGVVVAMIWPDAFLPFFVLAAIFSLLYAKLP